MVNGMILIHERTKLKLMFYGSFTQRDIIGVIDEYSQFGKSVINSISSNILIVFMARSGEIFNLKYNLRSHNAREESLELLILRSQLCSILLSTLAVLYSSPSSFF